jgi:hypothetical protein
MTKLEGLEQIKNEIVVEMFKETSQGDSHHHNQNYDASFKRIILVVLL